MRFTALGRHIDVAALEEAFFDLKKRPAPGVDGLTWEPYEADLGRRLKDLHAPVHRGAYRALPSRRVFIPKPDGRQRPLAVAALEDKIVQRATATAPNAKTRRISSASATGSGPNAARMTRWTRSWWGSRPKR